TIGKDDLGSRISRSDVRDRLAIFRRTQNDGDFIARLQRTPRPTGASQDAWTVRFDAPVHNLAVLVFDIEVDLRMRIRPDKLRNGSLDRNSRLLVVCRVSVMRRCRYTQKQKCRNQSQRSNASMLHELLLPAR